jgi:GIY-YIG catalytic domain
MAGAKSSATAPPRKTATARRKPEGEPLDVAAIRNEIQKFLGTLDANGRRLGTIKCGVYAFYDYDGEPIYIGQTYEGFGVRLRRHLTGRRSDAVAKNVLDPFEVAEISVWPMDFGPLSKPDSKAGPETRKAELMAKKVQLDRAEYSLYVKVVAESSFKAVLNEAIPKKTATITLPPFYRCRIIPEDIFPLRNHPDVRISRRASTIAALARVISERKVGKRLRSILLTQAQRLERLASDRLADFAGAPDEADEEIASKG